MPADRPVLDRLLDATLDVAADHGLSRLSVGDVAKRAGLSRQTLYKHVGSKEELIARAVQREAERIMTVVVAAAETVPDDQLRSLQIGILTLLEEVRSHPLLDRLLATEPEALLPLLVDGRGSVLGEVHDVACAMLAAGVPDLGPEQVEAGADLLSRMLTSYAVRSPTLAPELVATSLSHAVIAAMVAATPVEPPR